MKSKNLFTEDSLIISAKQQIDCGELSLVIVTDSGGLHKFNDSGVKSLIGVYENSPEILKNAVICDRIVGKAAAAIFVLGGVRAVYGKVTSEAGRAFLQANGIMVEADQLVQRILNRTGDGFCPIEEAALPAAGAAEAYNLIKEKLFKLNTLLKECIQ